MKVEMSNVSGAYVQNEPIAEKKADTEVKEEQVKEAPKSESTAKSDKEKTREVVEKMNQELKSMDNTSIEFKIHESNAGGLNKVSIKVVEKESEKVIVEIPSEEAIEFSEKMDEITGMLFDHSR